MAKNNEKFRWLAKTAIALVVIVVATAVAWGVLKERVNNNRDRIVVVEEKAEENKTATIGLTKDIGYLTEKVDRNYTVQQQILTEIKELHK